MPAFSRFNLIREEKGKAFTRRLEDFVVLLCMPFGQSKKPMMSVWMSLRKNAFQAMTSARFYGQENTRGQVFISDFIDVVRYEIGIYHRKAAHEVSRAGLRCGTTDKQSCGVNDA